MSEPILKQADGGSKISSEVWPLLEQEVKSVYRGGSRKEFKMDFKRDVFIAT